MLAYCEQRGFSLKLQTLRAAMQSVAATAFRHTQMDAWIRKTNSMNSWSKSACRLPWQWKHWDDDKNSRMDEWSKDIDVEERDVRIRASVHLLHEIQSRFNNYCTFFSNSTLIHIAIGCIVIVLNNYTGHPCHRGETLQNQWNLGTVSSSCFNRFLCCKSEIQRERERKKTRCDAMSGRAIPQ